MVTTEEIHHAKILIVDDLVANVKLLEMTLRGDGYTSVDSTMNPCEVCDLQRTNRYDLILLDLQMPVMDGFQVMEALNKQNLFDAYLSVLVVTAQPDHKIRALQSGAKDCLSKPSDTVEVRARVRNRLQIPPLHTQLSEHSELLAETLHEVQESRELIRSQRDDLERLYQRVLSEQELAERLLLNVLPGAIVQRLKASPTRISQEFTPLIADSLADVTVLFADIVGFTKFSAGISPELLVEILNEIFMEFDRIADRCGLEKIKSIGDAYMAAAGLPEPARDHAERAAHMALGMLEALAQVNIRRGFELSIRIGINSGPVVAGVIGRRKFIYDVWGAAVNTASRMESHGIGGQIQISESTQRLLGGRFQCESRGHIEIKDMGQVPTWFLIGPNSNGLVAQY